MGYYELPRLAFPTLGDELIEVSSCSQFILINEYIVEHIPDSVALDLYT